jgi:cytochrome c oxidase subunit 2
VGKWWSFLFAAVMILCGGLFVVAPFVGWWLPEGVSTHADKVDYLFYFILAITGFFFILTEAIMCVFMYKYAAGGDKSEAPAEPGIAAKLFRPVTNLLHDQHRVEMAWTIVPALLLLYIAFAQVNTWAEVKYQSRMPTLQNNKTPLQVAVSARQFEWRVRYPSPERFHQWMNDKDKAKVDYASFAKVEQADDVHRVNEVHVIEEIPVVVHLSTRDVIHSFNLPHMRVKQDALPGKMIPVWFTPTKSNVAFKEQLGTWVEKDQLHVWELACAELCGWGHYRMIGRLYVHKDEQDFLDWLKQAESENRSRKSANR